MNQDIDPLTTIDTARKKRVRISLIDQDGGEVSLEEVVEKISSYIKDKIEEPLREPDAEPNSVCTRIMPLMMQSMGTALPHFLSDELAYFISTVSGLRWSTLMMSMISFSLFQFIQKKGLKVVTHEEDLTDEEIAEMTRADKIHSYAASAVMSGLDPQTIIRQMIDNGIISKEELQGFEFNEDDDE